MKKIFAFLLFATILISADTFAQSAVIARQDTTVHPSSVRIGYNRLDSQFLFWDRVSWKNIPLTLRATATLNFPSTAATAVADLTVSIPGARLGDEVLVGVPNAAITTTSSFTGWVSAANTVTIRFSPKGTEDPASALFHVSVIKYYQWR